MKVIQNRYKYSNVTKIQFLSKKYFMAIFYIKHILWDSTFNINNTSNLKI